jgi:hypothetical protein
VCGDGTLDVTAGEICDDGGESATCNVDCTPAVCGDGVVDMAAGEECDDMGESAACDADCTLVVDRERGGPPGILRHASARP